MSSIVHSCPQQTHNLPQQTCTNKPTIQPTKDIMLNHPQFSSSTTQRHGKKSKSVSFSNEVSRVNGNAVTIQQEEHHYVPRSQDYFLGRSIVGMDGATSRADESESHDGAEGVKHGFDVEEVSHYDDNNHGENDGGNRVVVVRMGLLKCGHRYRVVVPILPLLLVNDDSDGIGEQCGNDVAVNAMHQLDFNDRQDSNEHRKMHNYTSHGIRTEARIIQDSWDDVEDLRGEMIETSDDGTCHVGIVLSTRQRGPYCGRLAVELVPAPSVTDKTTPMNNGMSSAMFSNSVMSIVVEASIMGKGMGTPQLRNGVVCLGKLAGYDSDEETEWQGFD
ncbi:hypothetical protein ACHAW6_004855 [Cyclotella cf. meneghiniana]